MNEPTTCPLSQREVLDLYFLEHRAKLIDIAAFLDRIGRAAPGDGGEDFRLTALRSALELLTDGEPHRARRVLARLSDPSTDLPESARGMKGALGAPPEVS